MINSQDIKKGVAVRMDGGIWVCIDFQHRKPGKGNTIMIIKLKNVTDGRVLERRFNIGEKLEEVQITRRPYQYLYKEGEDYIFMNQETYDQTPIPAELVTGVEYMKESDIVEVVSDADTDTVLYARASRHSLRARYKGRHRYQYTEASNTRDWCGDSCASVHRGGRTRAGGYTRRQLPAARQGVIS